MKNKKIQYLTLSLLVIVGLMCFFEVRSWFAGKNFDIFTRVFFSNRGLAKNIEIKSYILTKNQLTDFFKDLDKDSEQLTYKKNSLDNSNELHESSLVLCVKNLNGGVIWGTLLYRFYGYKWHSIDIPALGEKGKTLIYIIPLGLCDLGSKKDGFLKIKTKWKHLYTK